MMPTNTPQQNLLKEFRKKGYGIVGKHSAVKPCLWTKKSLLDEDVCYKQVFYGIESHRCLQMSPAAYFCTHRCIFCWRPLQFTLAEIKDADDPEFILEESIKVHRQLLVGYKGNPKTNMKKWEEAREPRHIAISLIGEPTLYPFLDSLIDVASKKNMTTFLVTNGTKPESIISLEKLPTQLYVSITATNEEMHRKINRPVVRESWNKILETLKLLPSINTRKVLRMTLVKNVNMDDVEGYAKLVDLSEPDFIEAKAFMLVGSARERLTLSNMPSHTEIREFSEKLATLTSYKIISEKRESRVVLLSNNKKDRFINAPAGI